MQLATLVVVVYEFLISFFSGRRGHTRCCSDWSSDVCSSDLIDMIQDLDPRFVRGYEPGEPRLHGFVPDFGIVFIREAVGVADDLLQQRLQFRVALLIGAGGARQGAAPGQSNESAGESAQRRPR